MKDPATFVRITAALILAFSILCLLMDSFGILLFGFLMQKTFAAMDYSNAMGPVSAWRINNMCLYYGFHIFVSLLGLASSLGALYKKPWAITAFTYFLSAIILFHFANLGMSVAALFTLPDNPSMNGIAFHPSLMIASSVFGVFWTMALIGLYAWLWFCFRKKDVRTVFD